MAKVRTTKENQQTQMKAHKSIEKLFFRCYWLLVLFFGRKHLDKRLKSIENQKPRTSTYVTPCLLFVGMFCEENVEYKGTP